jgi:hypothetical protein
MSNSAVKARIGFDPEAPLANTFLKVFECGFDLSKVLIVPALCGKCCGRSLQANPKLVAPLDIGY